MKTKPRRWWYAVEMGKERYVPDDIDENTAPALFDTRDRAEAGALVYHGEKIVQVKLVKRRTGWKGKSIKKRWKRRAYDKT